MFDLLRKCCTTIGTIRRQYDYREERGEEEMDKAERLAQIMFEEDEIRYNNNEETIYFTKEDFEAEQREREDK